jgi:hypothetical protein
MKLTITLYEQTSPKFLIQSIWVGQGEISIMAPPLSALAISDWIDNKTANQQTKLIRDYHEGCLFLACDPDEISYSIEQ